MYPSNWVQAIFWPSTITYLACPRGRTSQANRTLIPSVFLLALGHIMSREHRTTYLCSPWPLVGCHVSWLISLTGNTLPGWWRAQESPSCAVRSAVNLWNEKLWHTFSAFRGITGYGSGKLCQKVTTATCSCPGSLKMHSFLGVGNPVLKLTRTPFRHLSF